MSLQLVPTTVHRYLKLPQYVEETTYGTTPNSATFVDMSVINSIRTTYANATEMYRKLGRRTMYKYIKMGTDLTWSCSYSPVDTTLMRYGSETATTIGQTGTIEKSLTVANSRYVNTWTANGPLVETFYLRKGSKCDSMTVTTTSRGMVVVDMDWISSTIVQSQSANGGLTTPTWVSSPTTATPWSNLSGGCSPGKLTIGGTQYPFKTASFTVNNNLDAVDIDGCDNLAWLEPTTKEVTFTAEILAQKDAALETSIDAGTGLAASLVLNATGPKTATFTNLFLNNKTEDDASDETAVKTFTYSGSAEDVTITA